MTIGTNAAIEFFGTQDTVTSASSSILSGAFSVAADITAWTNDDDAPMANIVLKVAFAVAPDAYSRIKLYARPINVQSTNDQDTPDGNFLQVILGSFSLNNVTTTQYIPIEVTLPNGKSSQEYEFYIQNGGGQTISAGWSLYVTPKTIGPHV